jgi:hypothetical protein
MMLAFSIQQNREPACVPQRDRLHTDDGFWMLLSQLFLQFLSVYTTLYPVVRDHDEKIRIAAFWFRSLLGISVMTSIMATVVYSSSWKVATVLSFFSGFAATISAAQLAVGLDASVKDKGN